MAKVANNQPSYPIKLLPFSTKKKKKFEKNNNNKFWKSIENLVDDSRNPMFLFVVIIIFMENLSTCCASILVRSLTTNGKPSYQNF